MFLIRLTMAMTMTTTTRIGSTLPRSYRGFGAASEHPGLIQILGYAYMVRWLPADSLYSRCLLAVCHFLDLDITHVHVIHYTVHFMNTA